MMFVTLESIDMVDPEKDYLFFLNAVRYPHIIEKGRRGYQAHRLIQEGSEIKKWKSVTCRADDWKRLVESKLQDGRLVIAIPRLRSLDFFTYLLEHTKLTDVWQKN